MTPAVAAQCVGWGLTGVLLIDNLNGTYKEPNFDLSLIRFWLVIKREGRLDCSAAIEVPR